MSKADEMFEELGYEKQENDWAIKCKYVKVLEKTKYCIAFDSFERKIIVFGFKDREFRKEISMQELQAINEKVKELGWNEIN